jgi:hypothetical protein
MLTKNWIQNTSAHSIRPSFPRPQNVCTTIRTGIHKPICGNSISICKNDPTRVQRRTHCVLCLASDDKKDSNVKASTASIQFNPVYASICGAYALLMLFHNPYIFAALTILTIMPQNSSTTSLNSLVLIFYDSGLFMNFAGNSIASSCNNAVMTYNLQLTSDVR